MEEMNISLYRAKRIDSDEYVVGYYEYDARVLEHNISYQYKTKRGNLFWKKEQIDPTTLAIHFKDMIDSQGNKIFASLSGDGKGGDIVSSFRKSYAVICYGSSVLLYYIEPLGWFTKKERSDEWLNTQKFNYILSQGNNSEKPEHKDSPYFKFGWENQENKRRT